MNNPNTLREVLYNYRIRYDEPLIKYVMKNTKRLASEKEILCCVVHYYQSKRLTP